jgi:peptidoglycan/xylan/chitin deacetylase (PgdA/CDA1 family)
LDEKGSPVTIFDPNLDACTQGNWAITIDDGPKDLTLKYIELLKKYDVRATFFVIGANVVNKAQWADNLKAAYDAGHQIGLHSWTHRKNTNLTNEQVVSEWIWTALAVKQVIGKIPRYVRPPCKSTTESKYPIFKLPPNKLQHYLDGDKDERITGLLSNAMQFKVIGWNVLLNDTAIPANDAIDPSQGASRWNVVNATNLARGVVEGNFSNLIALPDVMGYDSLHHELSNEHYVVLEEVLKMVKPKFPTQTVAHCVTGKDDVDEMYFKDDEPFAKFMNGIKLPLTGVKILDAETGKELKRVNVTAGAGRWRGDSGSGLWGMLVSLVGVMATMVLVL